MPVKSETRPMLLRCSMRGMTPGRVSDPRGCVCMCDTACPHCIASVCTIASLGSQPSLLL